MYLPVIRRVATMATALIQKMTIKNKPCFNNTLTGKSLRGNLQEKLTKFLFKLYVGNYSREPPRGSWCYLCPIVTTYCIQRRPTIR